MKCFPTTSRLGPINFRAGFLLLLTLLAPLFSPAAPAQEVEKILVSMGSDQKRGSAWAKSVCDLIHDAWNHAEVGPLQTVQCIWLRHNEMTTPEMQEAQRSGQFILHLQIREYFDEYALNIQNLSRRDQYDFQRVGYRVDKERGGGLGQIAMLSMDFRKRYQQRMRDRALLLRAALPGSTSVQIKDGQLIDRQTQTSLTPNEAFDAIAREDNDKANLLRAGVELGVALGLATANYVRDHSNKRDWEFSREDWLDSKVVKRHGIRFDDNSPGVNYGHAWAGTGYYLVCRSNGMNQLEAFLCTATASSIWEFVVEYREVVSINDQAVTIVGGSIIGETLHLIARAFAEKGDTLLHKTLSALFDGPSAFNNWLDKKYGRSMGNRQRYPLWSEIQFEFGQWRLSSQDESRLGARFDGKVINLPQVNQPGAIRKIIYDTVYAHFNYESTFGKKDEYQAFQMVAQAAFAAYHAKQLAKDEKGELIGYSLFVGPAGRVEAFEKGVKSAARPNDFMVNVSAIGTTLHMTGFARGLKVTASFSVFGDFALMRSIALENFEAENEQAKLTSVLKNHGYYYGFGHTKTGEVVVEYDRWAIGFTGTSSQISMNKNNYRDQEFVSHWPEAKDRNQELEGFLVFRLGRDLFIKFSHTDLKRTGSLDQYREKRREVVRSATLIYKF